MVTVALPAIQTELAVATVVVVAVEVLPNAIKKIPSSWAALEISSSKKLNRSSCKVTCNQFAFAC